MDSVHIAGGYASPFGFGPHILSQNRLLTPNFVGAVVMLFFVILGGVTYTPPLNQTFFISADLSSFHTNLDSPTGITLVPAHLG
jgi:hypothetical protein